MRRSTAAAPERDAVRGVFHPELGPNLPGGADLQRAVTVTGTPVLTLSNGTTETYSSTSGNTLVFTSAGSVSSTQASTLLDFAGGTYLTGGTITDLAGNAAVLPASGAGDPLASQNITLQGRPRRWTLPSPP